MKVFAPLCGGGKQSPQETKSLKSTLPVKRSVATPQRSVGNNTEIDALLCDFKGGAPFAKKISEIVVFARAHGQRLPMRDGKFPNEDALAKRLKVWERERLNLGAAYSKDRAALLDLLHKAFPLQATPHFE